MNRNIEERIKTCRWCYGIYIEGIQESHKKCQAKRQKFFYGRKKYFEAMNSFGK